MRRLLLTLCVSAFLLAPGAAFAQIDVGGQAAYGIDAGADVDAGLGVGARATLGLPMEAVPLMASLDFLFFFPDEDDFGGADVTWWEVNGNVVYMIPLPAPTVSPYVGGGINVAHASVELAGQSADDTEIGFNVLGGAKFNAGPVNPFVEGRFEVSGGEQFVITGGILFNVGPGL